MLPDEDEEDDAKDGAFCLHDADKKWQETGLKQNGLELEE